jgi:hypothetical protein
VRRSRGLQLILLPGILLVALLTATGVPLFGRLARIGGDAL